MSECLNQNFDDHAALYSLAHVYKEAEKWGHAFNLYRMVVALTNGSSSAWNAMGLCYQEVWNLKEAEKCFRLAVKSSDRDKETLQYALNNLGLLEVYKCNPKEALKWLNKALEINPHLEGAKLNRAYANLMTKNWSDGWKDWVGILGKVKERTERAYENDRGLIPRWDGSKDKTVVVYGEQGIGDEISFASCVPDLIKDSKQVLIECDHRLESLFKRSFRVPAFGTRFKGDPYSWADNYKIDARVSIGDLPYFYRNKTEDFPGTSYLVADPERRVQWKALFDQYRKPVIGIAWTGGTDKNNRVGRSLTLETLEPILRAVDATWVCLEYKDRSEEIKAFTDKTGIRILDYPRATQTPDYDDTAGLVAELDLVISVTTAVVHLSGALGKECWCIAPERPRWFYSLEGELDWYKSVRMFRKNKDWPTDEIVKLLKLRYEGRIRSI